ncbi:hypothetical protein MHYP_G00074530 [Metynnis hypsauchen]
MLRHCDCTVSQEPQFEMDRNAGLGMRHYAPFIVDSFRLHEDCMCVYVKLCMLHHESVMCVESTYELLIFRPSGHRRIALLHLKEDALQEMFRQ